MSGGLARLLAPRSVAVIGGGAVAGFVVENCRKLGFGGPVWAVHPTKAEVGGIATVARIEDLPEVPDAAFIGINRSAAVEAVAALARIGAGGAVVYASGFSEAEAELGDGSALQAELVAAAGRMPILGPNCYGFLNTLDGAALWPDQQGAARCDTGVAIITQSSNIAINLTMQRRGLPLAYLVTAGNQAQTSLASIGVACLDDPRVTALGLHIEGVGDLRGFEALAAQARGLGKPVVALKAGRSQQARAATLSHTASLAGEDAGAEALLRRLCIARVASLPELLETLKLLHVTGPLASDRIATISCSGGEASLAADAALDRALTLPPLTEAQRKRLRAALGPKVALANPLDYHTYIWGDAEKMGETYAAMAEGDLALAAVIADFPRADRCSDRDWEPVIAATAHAQAATGRPMAIVSTLPETLPEVIAERLIEVGIAPLAGLDDGLAALEAAAWLGQARGPGEPLLLPRGPRAPRLLTEAEGKALLARHGVPVPQGQSTDRAGLLHAAEGLTAPLVLKTEGPAHKTEAGGVALHLADSNAVLEAAENMPGDRFLVEEMVPDAVAELLVGVTLDHAHGYLLTLAAGGTLTELLDDRRHLLLPARRADIATELHALRIAPLLAGHRSKLAANLDTILDAIDALQTFVAAHPGQIEECEINPLICTPARAVAADVLLRMGDPDD